MSGSFPVLDLPPLAHRAKSENTDHSHAESGGHGPSDEPEGGWNAAVAGALDVDEGVADEPTGQTAEEDADEGDGASGHRGEGRETSLLVDGSRTAHRPETIATNPGGRRGSIGSMTGAGEPRVILHVDMDAFYVSVELLRRPELIGLPVVVGGDGNRGVVAAASYEARRHGVHSAMASVTARRRCPDAVFLPADHQRYAEVSAQVRAVFDSVSPHVEPLALDEAFLDVTGARALLGEPIEIATLVRSRVADEVGLGCSVGVASNKFVAKLASVEAKPIAAADGVRPGRGVVIVAPGDEASFVAGLPVERLWGVGPKTLARLHDIGIRRVPDIVEAPPGLLEARIGAAAGAHLRRLALGIDDRPVETDRTAKSIGQEETFGSDVADLDAARAELVRLADAVAARLRTSTLAARTVTLKAKFADFQTVTRSVTEGAPLDTAVEIVTRLEPALAEVVSRGALRLLGVSASNLVEPVRQLDLWSSGTDQPAHDSADRALDEIRARFGRSSIGRASGLKPRTR